MRKPIKAGSIALALTGKLANVELETVQVAVKDPWKLVNKKK